MRLLVTGASGFVGWNAVRHFAERGHDVAAAYFSFSHYLHRVAGCLPVQMDLTDGLAVRQVVARFQPDVVIHAAAHSRPQESGDADRLLRVNVEATVSLAQAAADAGARMLYLSTDLVYDSDAGLCNEETPTNPSGAGHYSRSKLMGEDALRASDAEWIIVRCALMYGDGTPRSRSFTQFIDRSWAAGETAPLFNDQYRSILYVGDLVSAIDLLCIGAPQSRRLFVCGGGERFSRSGFGLRYADACGVDRSMCRVMRSADLPGYAGGASDITLDCGRLQALGWRPRALEECFAEMLAARPLEYGRLRGQA
ncbi:MAG: sugar nucleotide-binding protein [Bacteroidetes bacterium]|nr:sugar nucleotide-binding protein [Bacteroidota bacterium]